MMGKKNLEQLFKDTFRDFGEVPDERVWQAIEVSLDHKRKRNRMVPIWWQLGGAAAAVAILLYTLAPSGPMDPGEVDPIITDTQNERGPEPKDIEDHGKQQASPTHLQRPDPLVNTSGKKGPYNSGTAPRDPEREEIANTENRPVGISGNPGDRPTVGPAGRERGERDRLARQETRDSLEDRALSTKNPMTDPTATREALAQNTDKALDNKNVLGQNAPGEEDGLALKEAEGEGKKSIYDAIREMEEEEVAASRGTGKWSVGPSVGPVYFGASGDGSPINSEFSTNSKSGNFNLSYGLSVAYEVGKKVKIRTGIHKVNYGYDTKDVAFSTSMTATSSRKFDNINYNKNSRNIIVESRSIRYANDFLDSPSGLVSKEVIMNEMPVLDGKMVQELGYIEVPLEVNYALVDKKFGVDLIGGVSSLFLVDNTVLLESQSLVTEMGEANNANSMNFSANVGMGLNYKFSPKVQLNLEPMFKYQLNTFSKTAGNFHPFSVGVYSGVSFKF